MNPWHLEMMGHRNQGKEKDGQSCSIRERANSLMVRYNPFF